MVDSTSQPQQRTQISGETPSLVLGIISIVLGIIFFGSFIGLILGIIGIALAVSARNKASQYNLSKESVAKPGLILSLIGTCLCALESICCVVYWGAIMTSISSY